MVSLTEVNATAGFRSDWKQILCKILKDHLGIDVKESELRLTHRFAVAQRNLFILLIKGKCPRFINLASVIKTLTEVSRGPKIQSKQHFRTQRMANLVDWDRAKHFAKIFASEDLSSIDENIYFLKAEEKAKAVLLKGRFTDFSQNVKKLASIFGSDIPKVTFNRDRMMSILICWVMGVVDVLFYAAEDAGLDMEEEIRDTVRR